MTSFIVADSQLVDKNRTVASVTYPVRHCLRRGKTKPVSEENGGVGGKVLGESFQANGSFSEPLDHLVSFMYPQNAQIRCFRDRDYPWRRRAYDRTLACPDLARAINDFLSSDVEFVSNDDAPVQLCA